MILLGGSRQIEDGFGDILREQLSTGEDLPQQILRCGESLIRRESKQLHGSWKILQKNGSFQQCFSQGIRCTRVAACRCFFQKGNRTVNVLGKIHTLKQCFPQEVFRIGILFLHGFFQPTQSVLRILRDLFSFQEQFAESVHGIIMAFPRCSHEIVDCFFHIPAREISAQIQFPQAIHGIGIAKLRRLFKVHSGLLRIFLCSCAGKVHLAQTVVQLVIRHILLDLQESLIRLLVPLLRCRLIRRSANPIPAHASQLILSVGIRFILICGRHGKQSKRFFFILFHALAPMIQTAQGIGSEGISLRNRFFIPLGSFQIVLIHAIAEGVHLANPVSEIPWLFLLWLSGAESREGFPEPFLCLFFILLTSKTGQNHFAKIMHSKTVATQSFFLQSGQGLFKIRFGCLGAIEEGTGRFIFIRPPSILLPAPAARVRAKAGRWIWLYGIACLRI